jgi:hypothetical protein
MHAVLITFQSTASLDDLVGPFTDYAHSLGAVPGLVAKTWLRDGATLGGFHLFAGRRDADAYLAGALVAGLTANPAFADFQIRHYDVLEDLSRITRSPQLAAV